MDREELPPSRPKRTAKPKRFGVKFTCIHKVPFNWDGYTKWYESAKQRDAALVQLSHNTHWATLSKVER